MRNDHGLNVKGSAGVKKMTQLNALIFPQKKASRGFTCLRAELGGAMLSLFGLLFFHSNAQAQPAGWNQVRPIVVTEHSGASLTGYQLRLVIDTSTMAPSAADLRFGAEAAGTTILEHWVESGAGTANTVVWVKIPSIPASGQTIIYQFSGNPGAANTSTLDVFGYDNPVNNSATLQVQNGNPGGVPDSQRGFRFQPNEDVLMVGLGKREPNGSTRYITLFDVSSQDKLAQMQVSGPAATYVYQDLPQPMWLSQGVQYILTIHQGPTDAYYYGPSTQINPRLTYLDVRYCNSCTQDTFPTNSVDAFHYGYPDFQFRTRQHVSPSPTWVYGSTPPVAPGLSAIPGDGQASFAITPPSNDGGSLVQSYSVSCTQVGGGSPVTNTGNASPIIVTGLANGTTYSCTATATNAVGVSPESTPVNVTPTPALTISSSSFGNLKVGQAFSLSLAASGGTPPYIWTATDVSQPLPAGLSLSADGVLTGTPTAPGDYTSLITVADSSAVPQSGALMVKAAGTSVSQVFSGKVTEADAAIVTPVPTLSQWGLMLLTLALAGVTAVGLRRIRTS